ncbi:hypothetical protein K6W76_32835 [Burkholderia anthina]|uniref:hypothetical protein n=1 Tax=Burkholderia anthina TaxID=179879 RepID=UPI00158943E0|nr:hypothetical protein [Burkholderia anthina]MBY4871214.1 hypothetical protein [Burkholderia anthina]
MKRTVACLLSAFALSAHASATSEYSTAVRWTDAKGITQYQGTCTARFDTSNVDTSHSARYDLICPSSKELHIVIYQRTDLASVNGWLPARVLLPAKGTISLLTAEGEMLTFATEETISKDLGSTGSSVAGDRLVGSTATAAPPLLRVSYQSEATTRTPIKLAGLDPSRNGGASSDGQGAPSTDSDVMRYTRDGDRAADYSVRLTRNRGDFQPDASKRGYYFYQNYQSSRPGPGSLFGFAANISRTGGNRLVVPAQLNGYALDPAGGGAASSVWGVATEAWNGNPTTEPVRTATLVGGEFAVFSQYDKNTNPIVGVNPVFYNRAGNAADVFHGNAGSNQFNKGSVAVLVSNGFNKPRPPSGAYSGWNTGIGFESNSLDKSVDRGAIGIDLGKVNPSVMLASIKLPTNVPVIVGTAPGNVSDGFVYRDDLKGNTGRRIEFVRDIGGKPAVKATLDLGSNGPTGTIMAYGAVTTAVGTTGSAAALPAAPAKYIEMRDITDGKVYAIPLYNIAK